jgi:hypothetical protein
LPRTSAQRKFIRGLEQVRTLCEDVRAFEESQAYELRTERKLVAPDDVRVSCFAVEREAPRDHWPLLLGEAIHNLRASLDHAIYAASSRSRHRAQYPIFIDAHEFDRKGLPMITVLPPSVRKLIEDAQPFNTNPERPRSEPLAFLNRLSNVDKHRTLSTVAANVEVPGISYWGSEGIEIAFTDAGDGRELEDGTQVMAFTIVGPKAQEMNVRPDLRFQVRVERLPLAGSLQRIAYAVWKAVTEVETGQPFPLITPPLLLLPDDELFPTSHAAKRLRAPR